MTRLQRVASWFRAHPNQWIDGLKIAKFGGQYAWRSRCSQCRTQLGMTIENRQRRTASGVVSSQYRFVA